MESICGRMSFYSERALFFFPVRLHSRRPRPRFRRSAQTVIALFSFQVNTAVKFLQNPKVRQSPLATRTSFLKKKGEKKPVLPLKALQKCASTARCTCWVDNFWSSLSSLHGGEGGGGCSIRVKGHSCSSLPQGSDRGRFGFRGHDSGPVNK